MKKPKDLVEYDDFSLELDDNKIEIAIDWGMEYAWRTLELDQAKALRDKLTEMINYLEHNNE